MIIDLLNFLPLGAAIAEDGLCQKVTVNKAMADVMRTVWSEKIPANASFTSLPFYKAYHDGQPLDREDFPLRQAVLHGKVITDYEMEIVRPDGSMASVLAYATPWREDGEITGGYAVYVDVSPQRRAETEVKALREQLERISKISATKK